MQTVFPDKSSQRAAGKIYLWTFHFDYSPRRESNAFAARRERQEFFPRRTRFIRPKKEEAKKKKLINRPHTAEYERKFPMKNRNKKSILIDKARASDAAGHRIKRRIFE